MINTEDSHEDIYYTYIHVHHNILFWVKQQQNFEMSVNEDL